jgi:hypothetical protein
MIIGDLIRNSSQPLVLLEATYKAVHAQIEREKNPEYLRNLVKEVVREIISEQQLGKYGEIL